MPLNIGDAANMKSSQDFITTVLQLLLNSRTSPRQTLSSHIFLGFSQELVTPNSLPHLASELISK